MNGRQLAFPFPRHNAFAAGSFIAAPSNAEALAWLEQPASWPNLRLAVFGGEGAGKTHLLHRFADAHDATLIPGLAVRALVRLPDRGALAVDDADCAPEPEALLHLLNAAAEQRLPVLLAGCTPPARWTVSLPDLASRLRATATVGLGPLEDAILRPLLARLLADAQLAVPEAVQDWLLARLPRTGGALREAACRLDRASLAAGRGVNHAIAARVLADMAPEDAEEDAPDEDWMSAGAVPSPAAPRML